MAKSQVDKNREYRARLSDEQRKDLNNRKRYSTAKSYIKLHATTEQLNELKQLIDDKLKPWGTIGTKREQSRR